MTSDPNAHVITVDELAGGENASTFHGHRHGAQVSFFLVVVVPAGTPHRFVSRSETHRQVSIHPVPRMETEWLESSG
jgi:hypothetical protein